MKYNAGQISSLVKIAAKKDMPDFGEDADQDSYIFECINLFLFEHARVPFLEEESDTLTITSSGYVTFKKNSQDITDIYEPQMVFKYTASPETYTQVRLLRSFDGGDGWYRGGPYSKFYLRNQSGDFRLHYLRYPAKITLATQYPEFPESGYAQMVTWIVSRLKLTKNYLDEAALVGNMSDKSRLAAVRASVAARGTNQMPPSDNDAITG